MTKDAASIVRACKRARFDDVVASVSTSRTLYLKVTNSKVDSIVEKQDSSGSILVSKDKKVFFTELKSLDDAGISASIGNASKTVPRLQVKEDYFGIQDRFERGASPSYDKSLERIDSYALSDLALEAINEALSNNATKVAGTVVVSASSHELATSNGFSSSSKNSAITASFRLFKAGASFQDAYASRRLKDMDFGAIAKNTAEMLSITDKTGKINGGVYDVIYLPSPAGALMLHVTSAACMGEVETGSMLAGKLGKAVANRDLSIYDDGAIRSGVESVPFDQEGTKTRRTPVIRDGMLESYLHNYSTATKYKTESTGNAGLIRPRPWALVFKHRKSAQGIGKLIKSIDRGILITNTWYTRFSNYLTGDFSTVPRDLALYIENGEPKYAVKRGIHGEEHEMVGIRISDSMLRMLRNTECAANDSRQTFSWDIEGSFFMPSILVRGVRVTVA
jgi:PmbA protein